MRKNITRIGAFAAAAALTLTLASCSGGQSVAEACAVADKSMTKAANDMQEGLQQSMSDAMTGKEVNMSEAMAPLIDAMHDTQDSLDNSEVKAALGEAVKGFESYIEIYSGVDMNNSDEMQRLQEKLSEAQTKLESAGAGLEELCGA